MTAPPEDPRAALPPAHKCLGWWEGDLAVGTPYVSDGHLLLWADACEDKGLLARLRGRASDRGGLTTDWTRVFAPFVRTRADTVSLAALYDRNEGTKRPRLTARFLDTDGEVAVDVDARGLAIALGALGSVERVTADLSLGGSFLGLWRGGLVVGVVAGLRVSPELIDPATVRAGALPSVDAGPPPWPGPHLWPFNPYPAALDAVVKVGEDTEAARAASTALRDTLAATVTALGGAGDVLPTRAGWARVTLHEYHRTIGRERDRFRLEVRFARPRRAWRLLPGAEQSAADGTLTVAQSAPDGPVHYFARTMQYALLRLAVAEEARPSPEDARRAAADPSLILPGPTDPPRAAVLGPGVLPVYAVERASVPGRWRVRNRITWELLPGEGTSAAALTLARRLNAVARSPLGGGDP